MAAPSALAEVAFQELRPQGAAALAGDQLARQQPGDDLGDLLVPGPRPNLADVKDLGRPLVEEMPVAHEHDGTVPIPVDRLVGNDRRVLLLPENDAAR